MFFAISLQMPIFAFAQGSTVPPNPDPIFSFSLKSDERAFVNAYLDAVKRCPKYRPLSCDDVKKEYISASHIFLKFSVIGIVPQKCESKFDPTHRTHNHAAEKTLRCIFKQKAVPATLNKLMANPQFYKLSSEEYTEYLNKFIKEYTSP